MQCPRSRECRACPLVKAESHCPDRDSDVLLISLSLALRALNFHTVRLFVIWVMASETGRCRYKGGFHTLPAIQESLPLHNNGVTSLPWTGTFVRALNMMSPEEQPFCLIIDTYCHRSDVIVASLLHVPVVSGPN